jgi:ketosteroid isomerase-like protein
VPDIVKEDLLPMEKPVCWNEFATAWIAAWNAHDLDAILMHYQENVRFRSPFARMLTGCGVVEGKDALRSYWAEALQRRPALKFELVQLFRGDGTLALLYRDEQGRSGVETMEYGEKGKIVFSCACYDR